MDGAGRWLGGSEKVILGPRQQRQPGLVARRIAAGLPIQPWRSFLYRYLHGSGDAPSLDRSGVQAGRHASLVTGRESPRFCPAARQRREARTHFGRQSQPLEDRDGRCKDGRGEGFMGGAENIARLAADHPRWGKPALGGRQNRLSFLPRRLAKSLFYRRNRRRASVADPRQLYG